jgi:hypothetical protein
MKNDGINCKTLKVTYLPPPQKNPTMLNNSLWRITLKNFFFLLPFDGSLPTESTTEEKSLPSRDETVAVLPPPRTLAAVTILSPRDDVATVPVLPPPLTATGVFLPRVAADGVPVPPPLLAAGRIFFPRDDAAAVP